MSTTPIRKLLPARWLPQTLAGRVFLILALTTFLGTVVGLGLLYFHQFNRHVEETRASIEKVAEVSLQSITDSAVVTDYDAIARLLRRIVPDSPLREAVFIDAAGGSILASNETPSDVPDWLVTVVARSMPDLYHRIAIGGRHYGELVLRYDPARVASELWGLLLKTAGLAAMGLALSLVVMRYAMRRWLRTLDSLHALEAEVLAGTLDAQVTLMDDAPLEIRNAIEVVNRTAGSLRAQLGQRIDTLMRSLIDQVHRQNIITTFGQQALESDDLELLMQQAVEGVCTGLSVRHAALLIQSDATTKPRIHVGVGWDSGWVGRPAQQLLGAAAKDGRLAMPNEMLQAHGLKSLLTASSEVGSKQDFTLVAASPENRLFSDADRDFLRSLAHVLTAALERHRSREHLTYLARFDSLTGLPNRGLLFDRLESVLEVGRRQGTHAALLYLDLDRFKLVNDTLGHEAGDHLLVQAAQRMSACLRASDTVARLAGDEFAVLLPGLDGREDVEKVGRKVLAQLARPFEINGQEVFISASIGVAIYPDHGLEPTSLVRSADLAMYFAKHTGRNELRIYSEEMNARETDRLEIGTRLRTALERREFSLVYQPRVNLKTGCISGMEALLRWTHPERGPISPADFVPVLEETGLIIGVGEWVLREVAQQVVRWQAMGLTVPGVAMNLSARQFSSPEFDAQVRAVLAETGVDPSVLEFELTESMLMQEPAQAVTILEDFRSYGLRLSVDDFGTGYSSLSYLRRFPLDALKVDRTFVRDLATNSDDLAITLAIISMAHSLKLKVVAEGVETTAQLDLLSQAGCDEIQGYYFSRPVPAQELEHMLRDGVTLQKTSTTP